MITEIEYTQAIKIILQYSEQISKQTQQILLKTGITKTPKELHYDWDIHFPSMTVRLWHALRYNFEDKRICDITKKEFLSKRNCGKKSWYELAAFTGK